MLIYGISQSKTIPTYEVTFRSITVTRGDHRFNVTPEDDRLLFAVLYDNIRVVLFSKTSSIYKDFFCLDDYEKLESCFRK